MFSGKTTELMRRIRRYTHAKKRCQVIKYSKDTRYDSECASTHDRQKCAAVGCTRLSELSVDSLVDLDVIGIDEGQFFPDVVEFADRWASAGKVVIVGALDATFERRPFGHILELIPLAEMVSKLNAVCMLCHKDASFTKRIGSETAVEVIGGADKYLSTCRACFALDANSPTPQSPTIASASDVAAAAAVTEPASSVSPPSPSTSSAASSPVSSSASLSLLESPAVLPLDMTGDDNNNDEDDIDDSDLCCAPSSSTQSAALSSNKRISSAAAPATPQQQQQQLQPQQQPLKRKHSQLASATEETDNNSSKKMGVEAANKENAPQPIAC